MKNLTLLILCCLLASCNSLRPHNTPRLGNKISVATTAYTAKERDHLKYKNKTASNTVLKSGIAAARWDIFPVGTKLKISGKIYTVEDYGIALMKTRQNLPIIDIYQPTRKDMFKWGVRFFNDVQVVELGSYEKSLTILKDRLKYPHCRTMYHNIKNKL